MNTARTALAEANERRHRATLSAAQNAIALLQRQGDTVTFASVAKQAGVSRAWLYREPSIRELISLARSSTDRRTRRCSAEQHGRRRPRGRRRAPLPLPCLLLFR